MAIVSFAVLAWTLLLWPLSPLLRRGERAALLGFVWIGLMGRLMSFTLSF